jgi:hypothetical protein
MTHYRSFSLAAKVLVAVLLSNSLAFAAKRPADPAAMKAKIQARGVGQGVRVNLADHTETKGLIVAINDLSFTVRPKNSADVRQIEYAQLTGVHNEHLSRGQKVGITVVVIAAGIGITAAVFVHLFHSSFPKTI